jgi:uncharacterized protein with HEPN domain
MRVEVEKILTDIWIALIDLEGFTEGIDLDAYRKDSMRKAAVERKFEIIGEACTNLRTESPEILDRISDASQIIGFRNRLIHGYDSVDDGIVWDVLQRKLPILKIEVSTLLDGKQ